MQITRAGEYGVRGLTYLARRAPGQTAMIEEISRAERIPRSFLAKIFQSLARTGLVKSARGAGGGFALSKTPANITILEIIEAVEGRFLLQRCLQAETECELLGGCALCDLLGEAQDGMRGPLSRTSLRDLMEKQDRLEAARGPKAGRMDAKNALNPAHTIP